MARLTNKQASTNIALLMLPQAQQWKYHYDCPATLLLIRLVFLSWLCSLANNPRHRECCSTHFSFAVLVLTSFPCFFYPLLVWLEAIAGNFVLSWLSRSYYIAEQSSDVLHSSWPTYFLLNKKTLFYVLALVVNRYVTYGHVYRLKKPLRSTLRK